MSTVRNLRGSSRPWTRSVAIAAATAAVWIAGSAISDLTDFADTGVAAFYLPVGLVVAFLVVWRRDWPAIVVGAALGNLVLTLVVGGSVGDRLLESAVNIGESALIAWLIVRWRADRFSRPRDAAALGVAGVLGVAPAAVVGAILLASDAGQPVEFIAQNWFAADLMGVILAVPLVVSLLLQRPTGRQWLTLTALVVVAVGLGAFAVQTSARGLSGWLVFAGFMAWYLLMLLVLVAGVTVGVVGMGMVQVPAALAAFASVTGGGADDWLVRQALACVLGLTLLLSVLWIRAGLARREASERLARDLFERSPVGTARVLVESTTTGDRWMISQANPALHSLLGGYGADAVAGVDLLRFVHPGDRDLIRSAVAADGTGEVAQDLRLAVRGTDEDVVVHATIVRVSSADTRAAHEAILVLQDVTEQRIAERRLRRQARIDPLTGMLNRRAMAEELEASLAAQGDDATFGVVFVDLDKFKWVNDTLGHAAGDEVLSQAGARLTRIVRPRDLVARYGGDEFIVLARVGSDEELEALRIRVEQVLEEPFDVGAREVHVGGSAGLALARNGDDVDALLQRADASMYERKVVRSSHEEQAGA